LEVSVVKRKIHHPQLLRAQVRDGLRMPFMYSGLRMRCSDTWSMTGFGRTNAAPSFARLDSRGGCRYVCVARCSGGCKSTAADRSVRPTQSLHYEQQQIPLTFSLRFAELRTARNDKGKNNLLVIARRLLMGEDAHSSGIFRGRGARATEIENLLIRF
jgi:hypothetical protein